jgi:hypothetical protein
VAVSNFPVDALIKFFPRPSARTEFYGTAGMGFNYQHTDVSYSSRSDYFFGTQAGVGLALHGSGAAGLIVDAVYHWIFATGTDTDFLALRAGLLLPLGARPR